MNTQTKKPTPTARLASDAASKVAENAYGAVKHTRNQAEKVFEIGGKAVKEFLDTSATEAQKAHEKTFAMAREGAEQIAKSADAITKVLYDGIGVSRDNVETCIECGNMAASLAKDISSEVFEYTNKTFSDNVELSKEFFTCRTINDMFELQNRATKSLIDNFFNESVKLSGMLFEYATEALEPINERVSEATEQFNKSLAA